MQTMSVPAKQRATCADVLAAPDGLVAELVDGKLVTSPRPGPFHATAASALGGELWSPFRRGRGGPGGWVILDEPELHLLGAEVLVPDVVGWRVERMPELPVTAWFETVPDWVCEVASPATAAFDRADKMPVYARAGVKFAWIVEPTVQTSETYALENQRWVLLETFRGDRGVRAAPFDAIELEVGVLWGQPAGMP
jgi:Uma2 family endonuclease